VEVAVLVVKVRSFFVRHRHVRRTLVVLLAMIAGGTLAAQAQRLEHARRAWVDQQQVWVADTELAPGGPVRAHLVELPVAAVPDGALSALEGVDGLIAVQRVGAGEVITTFDAMAELDRLAPADWRTVAVSAGDGTVAVSPGDRVDVVADGVVLATDGIVVGADASSDAAIGSRVVVVAVPAVNAPRVAAAAHDQRADLLGHP
jgi:hypothetical protein